MVLKFLLRSIVMVSLELVQGCAQMPAGSALALSRIDPMTTDAAQIRVAYVGPEDLRVDVKKAHVEIKVENGQKAFAVNQKFALVEVPAVELVQAFHGEVGMGQRVMFFKLRPDEAVRLERARDLYASQLGSEKRGRGTLSIGADGCLEQDTGQPLLISAYLSSADTNGFVALFEGLNMRDLAKTTGDRLERCTS